MNHETGRVITGQKGEFCVLGWHGEIEPKHRGALTVMPEYEWKDNEIVGTCETIVEAKELMRTNSQMFDYGNGRFYLLSVYKNQESPHPHA